MFFFFFFIKRIQLWIELSSRVRNEKIFAFGGNVLLPIVTIARCYSDNDGDGDSKIGGE